MTKSATIYDDGTTRDIFQVFIPHPDYILLLFFMIPDVEDDNFHVAASQKNLGVFVFCFISQ